MQVKYACQTAAHALGRRQFLGALGGTAVAGGLGLLTRGATAADLQQRDMRMVVFNMHGGLSQLESWDPKPGTKTGRSYPRDSHQRAWHPHQRTAPLYGAAECITCA